VLNIAFCDDLSNVGQALVAEGIYLFVSLIFVTRKMLFQYSFKSKEEFESKGRQPASERFFYPDLYNHELHPQSEVSSFRVTKKHFLTMKVRSANPGSQPEILNF